MKSKNKSKITWVNGLATVHFLALEDPDYVKDGIEAVSAAYKRAQVKAKEFGGQRVHCKSYGGGIGFRSEQAALECVDHFNAREF